MKYRFALVIAAIGLMGILLYFLKPSTYCESAFDEYGIKVRVCPTGTPRQVVSVWGRQLKRSGDGEIEVSVTAKYTTAKADEVLDINIEKFSSDFFLVNANGKEVPIEKKGEWESLESSKKIAITIPQVIDGDYLLRTKMKSKVGVEVVDMKLPLYAPARIHILTDRPLYEPGNQVQFRALALRANDLSPIDNRPGTWIVRSPAGEVLLEEKAPAKEWGVVSGDFPLAKDAEEGVWTVAWRSGKDEESTSFRVEPFVLPRFRVDSASEKSYYQSGESPRLSGAVVYSSGAPVSGAKLEISWSASGAWPPPSEWIAGGELPRSAESGPDGRFELQLPTIPQDLRGRCTLRAYISAVDPAGDRIESSASILLSEDAVQVTAVTEFNDGLVENTNNRVYLRVTSPEGLALGGAKVNVKRAWAPGDEGIEAELDADGVARIQFDPGRPVNVVIPPMPVRKTIQTAAGASTLSGLQDLVSGQQAGLADQIAAEKWLESLQSCSRWVQSGSEQANVSFRVGQSGILSAMTVYESPLNRCVANAIAKRRLPAGKDRLYAANFLVQASDLPALNAAVTSSMSVPSQLQEQVNSAAADSRECLSKKFNGGVPWVLFWRVTADSQNVEWSWMKDVGASKQMPIGLDRCILGTLGKLKLPIRAGANSIGLVRYSLSQPGETPDHLRPQSTIIQGYELTVSVVQGTDKLGSTTLRMQPGVVPNLRLRATPVLAKAGGTVELAFFRGPDYSGDVPREIRWGHEGAYDTIELAKEEKSASFKLPENAKGWYEFNADGARALVFVRSSEELNVTISAAEKTYRPGQMAKLNVQTTIANQGAKAAVGLFGVDNSLSQIATLRGADDMRSIRPEISMTSKAFGSLDAQALSLGRIRGEHAAEATILRVESVPEPGEVDAVIYESAQTEFDPISELTDNFYIALAELHLQTRAWEASAPKGETITPKQMAQLWKQTLKSCESKGQSIVDAYGRPLRLHWLPTDLLELVDPAQVIADATRLPEDVENWKTWVMKEQP